jgi:hypothetical protein
MKQLVSRLQMEAFARALETTKNSKELPAEQFNALHANFRAEDTAGGVWTVGIHTAKWHRLEQGKWAPGNPPESLALDEQVLEALQTLAPLPKVNQPGEREATPGGMACSRCGIRIKPGKKFCPGCGAPATGSPVARVAQRCPRCGQTVAAGKKFCSSCGQQF